MTCGIYRIRFSGTDKVYIGQSRHVEVRWKEHLNSLLSNSHTQKLQQAYREFGKPIFDLLLECPSEDLDDSENTAIEIYKAFTEGLNSLPYAESTPTGKDLVGERNPRSKYSNAQIIEVVRMLSRSSAISLKEVALKLDIDYRTITNISSGIRHSWVSKVLPVEYTTMLSYKGKRLSTSMSATSRGIVYPNILSPAGVTYTITNVTAFAREHNLNAAHLGEVLRGKESQHKGWKIV